MRHWRLLSIVSVASVVSACAAGIATQQPAMPLPTGFRDIAWGTSVQSVREKMVLLEKGKNTEMYNRTGDKLSFGDAQLKSIHYAYFKGRFEGAYIASQPGSMTSMINTFQAQFGPGKQANKYISRYLWDGPDTAIFLDCNEASGTCEAMIASASLLAEVRADDAATANGARKDF